MPAREDDTSADPRGAEAVTHIVSRLLGRPVQEVTELVRGLGTRRFFRVRLSDLDTVPESVIVRVEDPATPATGAMGVASEPPLEPIRNFLEEAGLPVPGRYASHPEHGIEILEDVGDRSLELAAREASPEERRRLYHEACGLIPRMQRLRDDRASLAAFSRRLDADLIATKARKLCDWTLPLAFGRPTTEAERQIVESAFARIAEACEATPSRLAHRDFKAANLHVRPNGGLVMIDLQGAFLAPPEYDAVCLLRDSHIELPENEVSEYRAELRPNLPDAPGPEEFETRFDLITIIRVAKDVSHYLDAARSRGDSRYLQWVPTAISNLQAAARRARQRDASYADLAALIERIPPDTTSARPTAGTGCAADRETS